MIKVNKRAIRIIDCISDALLIFLSFQLAIFIRFSWLDGYQSAEQQSAMGSFFALTVLYSFLVVSCYYFAGRYNHYIRLHITRDITCVLFINAVGTIFYMALLYFVRFPDFSRVAIAWFFVFSTVFIEAKRLILLSIFRWYRQKGYVQKHVVVIGGGHLAVEYVQTARESKDFGVKVSGYVSNNENSMLGERLGSYSTLAALLEHITPDELIIALDSYEYVQMPAILEACEHSGVRTSIIPYYNDYLPNHPEIEIMGKCKLINIRTIPLDDLFSAMIKRSFDVVVSALMMIILSPVFLLTAIGIKITSPGPVMFCHERIGKNKKPFIMYKFRSMPVNVDHTGWSTVSDSRRTAFGSFIRKFSIDELPQLWNVLKGDMSLVGPRPEMANYVHKFSEEIPLYLVRQQVRPGMTGLAQINGFRGDTSIEKRIEYDIQYIENWSFLLDLKILAKTAFGGFVNHEQNAAKREGSTTGAK